MICFPRNNPKKTANNPKKLLAKIFRRANLYSPTFIKDIVSKVKEEKVVNPPNNPVKIKSLVLDDRFRTSAILQQRPIKKEPIILTDNIPQGKVGNIERCTHVEIPKRNIVPMAPPVIRSKTFIMLIPWCLCVCFSPGWLMTRGRW